MRKLDDEGKRKVLDFAKGLGRPPGISGQEAIRIARELNFSPEDLDAMERAIEEAFEVIDDDPMVSFDE